MARLAKGVAPVVRPGRGSTFIALVAPHQLAEHDDSVPDHGHPPTRDVRRIGPGVEVEGSSPNFLASALGFKDIYS